MKKSLHLSLLPLLFSILLCGRAEAQGKSKGSAGQRHETIASRIAPPAGYTRVPVKKGSFAEYLRALPLRPRGAKVRLYDGKERANNNSYIAVVNLPIGTRNLHQCADAVIRLRAEYLWRQGRYHDIHFNLTNGFRVDYSEWMRGNRLVVNGNNTSWSLRAQPSNTYDDFWAYCQMVFTYAGSYSLSKELQRVSDGQVRIGDVFIQGGLPGHVVIVVDMAQDARGNRVFLLAQSLRPAQELHVLTNRLDGKIRPWYSWRKGTQLATPQWVFPAGSHMRFYE
ncbi:MAG: hypothetical protein CSA07_04355 [Bacteroidia bacterium]|nr:MAG: hypothetical protein CSA07_04355 [Bacteroidia bacterium]